MVSLWMNMQQTLVPELHALRASIPEARFTRTAQRISRRCSHSGPARSLGRATTYWRTTAQTSSNGPVTEWVE